MRTLFCLGLLAAARLGGAEPVLADPGATVELPPLLVEAENGNGPHWRYGTLPGFVILSCCEDETTEAYAQRLWQLHQRLERMIPPRFLNHYSEPERLMFYSKKQGESLSKAMMEQIAKAGRDSLSHHQVGAWPTINRAERDSNDLLSIVDDGGIFGRFLWRLGEADESREIVLSRGHVYLLLRSHAPSPPPWFATGLAALYDQGVPQERTLEFEPEAWVGSAAAKALKHDPDTPRALLPLAELFAPELRPASILSDESAAIWRAESELFVRWALFSGDARTPDALWRFADAACRGPVTEADFRAAFGMDYADARDAMSDFLPGAVDNRPTFDVGELPTPPKVALRDATDMEIHAFKGELERRELRGVRLYHPDLLQLYSDHATKLMLDPYRKGEHYLPMVESLGLLYVELKDDATARAFLEEAWRMRTQRPLALATLADLRLADALAHPAGANRHLSASQTGAVMEVLEAAEGRLPPQPQAALVLLRLVVSNYPNPPYATQREMLRVAAERFPEIGPVALSAAGWQARSGHLAEAVHLADFALSRTTDPAQRQRLLALRNVLVAPASKSP